MSRGRPSQGWWIIVDGAVATAFRAREAGVLLPTLRQLQRTQPGVALKWFERGKVWATPEEARAALTAARTSRERRPRHWRPGGEHRDRRQQFALTRDQKRARFKARRRPQPAGGSGSFKPKDRKPK